MQLNELYNKLVINQRYRMPETGVEGGRAHSLAHSIEQIEGAAKSVFIYNKLDKQILV